MIFKEPAQTGEHIGFAILGESIFCQCFPHWYDHSMTLSYSLRVILQYHDLYQ